MGNLNNPYLLSKLKSEFKALQQRKLQAHMASLVNSTKYLREKYFQFYTDSSKKLKREYVPTRSVRQLQENECISRT